MAKLSLVMLLGCTSLLEAQVSAYEMVLDAAHPREFAFELACAPPAGPFELTVGSVAPGTFWPSREALPITRVEVRDEVRTKLEAKLVSPTRWRVERAGEGPVTVTWRVRASPLPSLQPFLASHGFLFDGARSLLIPAWASERPFTLDVVAPGAWTVTSSLRGIGRRFTGERASDLLTATILGGAAQPKSLMAGGRSPRFLFLSSGSVDAALTTMLDQRLVALLRNLPFLSDERRTPLLVGLDHGVSGRSLGSTAIFGLDPSPDDPFALQRGLIRSFLEAELDASSKPRALVSWDGFSPLSCDTLWFQEGVLELSTLTTLVAGGILDASTFCFEVGRRLTEHRGRCLAIPMSATESSRTLFERGGRDRAGVDPALHGFALALHLDLTLRTRGSGEGLSGLTRGLARKAGAEGYTREQLLSEASRLAERDLSPWFAAHVDGLLPLDFGDLFGSVGLRLDWHVWQVADPGFTVTYREGELHVTAVMPPSPMGIAGLAAGDVIQGIEGRPLQRPGDLDAAIARLQPGRQLALDVRRGKQRRTIKCTVRRGGMLEIPFEEAEDGSVRLGPLPTGALRDAGLSEGDVLYQIDKRRVHRLLDLADAVARLAPGSCPVWVERKGQRIETRVVCPAQRVEKAQLDHEPSASPAERDAFDRWVGRQSPR